MTTTFAQYLELIATALYNQDGLELAHLVRPASPHSQALVKEFRNPTVCTALLLT
jgi:hypothetical protein